MGKGNAPGGIATEKSVLIIAVLELVVGLGSVGYFLYVIIGKPFAADDNLENKPCGCKKYTDLMLKDPKKNVPIFIDQTKLWNVLFGVLWLVRGLVALGMGGTLLLGIKSKNLTFLKVNTMCSLAQLSLIVLFSYIILHQIEAHGFLVMSNVFYEFIIILVMAGALVDVKMYLAGMPSGGPRNQRNNPNAVYGMPPPQSTYPLHTHETPTSHSPNHEMPKISTTGEVEEPSTDPSEPASLHETSKGKSKKKHKGKKGSKSSKKSKKKIKK